MSLWQELWTPSPRNEGPADYLAYALGHCVLGAAVAFLLPAFWAWGFAALYLGVKEYRDWQAGASIGDCLGDTAFVCLGVAWLNPAVWIAACVTVTELRELARKA